MLNVRCNAKDMYVCMYVFILLNFCWEALNCLLRMEVLRIFIFDGRLDK